MSLYRKKPVAVEAQQFEKPYERVRAWCNGTLITEDGRKVAFMVVHTLEGAMRADIGDWIVRGVKGEFYPCKPDIFEQTYEPAGGER